MARVEEMSEIPPLIVVADDSIPQGVAGLAASRLVDRFGRPAVVLSVQGPQAVASGRSIPGFDIVEAISAMSDMLVRFGGHSQAAGFTVSTEHIDAVSHRLVEFADQKMGRVDLTPVLEIDSIASLRELSMDAHTWLASLEPFGKGNRRPLFASLGLAVREARTMGHLQQHLRLRVEQDGHEMIALAFNRAADWNNLGGQAGTTSLDLAYTLMLDKWQGQDSLALRVTHMRESSADN